MNSGIINPPTYVSCPSYWSGLQIPTNPPRYKCNTQLRVVRVTYPDELGSSDGLWKKLFAPSQVAPADYKSRLPVCCNLSIRCHLVYRSVVSQTGENIDPFYYRIHPNKVCCLIISITPLAHTSFSIIELREVKSHSIKHTSFESFAGGRPRMERRKAILYVFRRSTRLTSLRSIRGAFFFVTFFWANKRK